MKMNTFNTLLSPGECMDDKFQRHLLGRSLVYFMRGIAGALLMPLVVLHCLRWGHRVARQAWFSWFCSAAIYLSGFGIWLLSSRTAVDSRSRANEIICLCLALLITAIVSGRLQATKDSRHAMDFEERIWRHGLLHHHHHHRSNGRQRRGRHHDHHRWLPDPTTQNFRARQFQLWYKGVLWCFL
jgi:hypothetical protein